MSAYTYGSLTVSLPEHIEITDTAVDLPRDKAKRLARPRKGIERVCKEVADIMDANPEFTVPGVSSMQLRVAGMKSENIKKYVLDITNACKAIKQQSLLYDDRAYELVRRVNTQVKGEAKYNAQIKDKFEPLFHYFERTVKKTEEPEEA